MAVRTYIPGLLKAFTYLRNYLAANSTTLKTRMGDGLFALCQLVVDLAIIAIAVITAGEPAPDEPWSDFNAVNSLSSATINQVQGAIDNFYSAIGVEVGEDG